MRFSRLWPVLAGMLVGFLWVDASAQGNGSVSLQWTAPGDDSLTGTATRYDLRFSLFPINETNFVYCQGPTGLPKPTIPGVLQRVTVYGLLPGLRYYFALKTADERLNWSRISNVIAFASGANPIRRLKTLAHELAGSAGSLGFAEIGETAAALEQAADRVLDGSDEPAIVIMPMRQLIREVEFSR